MLSVCVPVYNYDIRPLVAHLKLQLKTLQATVELLFIDDGSDPHFKTLNRQSCEEFNYAELDENVGRAKIRNLFIDKASYSYLLFLDCDSLIIQSDFLTKYINVLQSKPQVVCGGRIYTDAKPENKFRLRWYYGKYRESQNAAERSLQPNKSFMTNNFLIAKELLAAVRFDESLVQYGHEDTLFGFELKKRGIVIQHIENPILNGDLESNSEYLNKTKAGILNLIKIVESQNNDLMQEVNLLRFYQKTKSYSFFILLMYGLIKPIMMLLLKSGYVSLFLFDIYKLGLFTQEYKRAKL